MADKTTNVLLDDAIHLQVGDQRDRPVNVFEEGGPLELRRTNKVGLVQLVLVEGVFLERLEQVGKTTNVTQQLDRHVLLDTLAVTV